MCKLLAFDTGFYLRDTYRSNELLLELNIISYLSDTYRAHAFLIVSVRFVTCVKS